MIARGRDETKKRKKKKIYICPVYPFLQYVTQVIATCTANMVSPKAQMAAIYASVLTSQPNPVSVQLQNILVSLERSAALITIAEATRNAAAMSAPIQNTKVTS